MKPHTKYQWPGQEDFKVLPIGVYVKKIDLSAKHVIIFSNFIGSMPPMLHTKPQGHCSFGSGKEDF